MGAGPQHAATRLAVLLPLTSKQRNIADILCDLEVLSATLCPGGEQSAEHGAGTVRQGNTGVEVVVVLGVDHDDDVLLAGRSELEKTFANTAAAVHTMVFQAHDLLSPPGSGNSGCAGGVAAAAAPLCRMWSKLAKAAAWDHGCQLAVLLGDDTRLEPCGWPGLVVDEFLRRPSLVCLLLKDADDPGFPSFPVIRVDLHLALFPSLLPEAFVNQGGDPFLAALYRRVGAVSMLPTVSVHNRFGGVQRSDDSDAYTPPRYVRAPLPHGLLLQLLNKDTTCLRAAIRLAQQTAALPASDGHAVCRLPTVQHALAGMQPDILSLDVLVPCYRVDLEVLAHMEDLMSSRAIPLEADVHWIIVIDNPSVPKAAAAWLHELQQRRLHRVRIRGHPGGVNLGASATRNRALDESLAELVVFWDDDVMPTVGCLTAYAAAARAHPRAVAFAGPTHLPRDFTQLWACAVHLSDCAFFWAAPTSYGKQCQGQARDGDVRWREVPWAVTANLAVRNTTERFDTRFPKTGGGEDIDFCLRVADAHVVAVPQAAVHHPWWGKGRRSYGRFWGWAAGDGALLTMYGGLIYTAAPSATELCLALLMAAGTCAVAGMGLCAAAMLLRSSPLASAWASNGAAASMVFAGWLFAGCWQALRACVLIRSADAALDVWRNCCLPPRVQQHQFGPGWRRALASLDANAIKIASEMGRLWGQWQRGGLPLVLRSACRRFDWFCGTQPGVRVKEQRRAVVCLGVYLWAAAVPCMPVPSRLAWCCAAAAVWCAGGAAVAHLFA